MLAGEALLIVEGEEPSLRQWDFVHCPPGTKHVIVGGETRPPWCSPSVRATLEEADSARRPLAYPASSTPYSSCRSYSA